ncbi:MAG: glycosyl hydrolase family 18 protein [Candidatus Carbobacillus sp.]|nr:glycosyl hydrolase family 18 protein [Candidatus Carbobacillus sp.]
MAFFEYEPGRPMRITKRRKRRPFFIGGAVILFLALVAFVAYGIWTDRFGPFVPNRAVEPFDGEGSLIFEGKQYADVVLDAEGEPLIALSFIQAHIDPSMTYDERTESLYMVRDPHVLRLSLDGQGLWDALTEAVPFPVAYPLRLVGTTPYVPLSLLERLYPVQRNVPFLERQGFSPPSKGGSLFLWSDGETVLLGDVSAPNDQIERWLRVRKAPNFSAPYSTTLQEKGSVLILGEEKNWYHIRTNEGAEGYVPKQGIHLKGVFTVRTDATEFKAQTDKRERALYRPLRQKIVLVWEYVQSQTPDPQTIPELSGVNVLAPTWFELKNEAGELVNRASLDYVRWAHDHGREVHATLTNGFDADRTHALLHDRTAQARLIQTLLEYVQVYELDGINIDFENVFYKDQAQLTQFVRELTAYLHAAGLTVSMDVTVKSSNENWSKVYDRKALGEIVDYIALMAYDEHWATSPVAGSVASLPWVEQGIQGLLEDVPPHKVLLGVPFYARLWQETTDAQGKVRLTQKALSMKGAENWLKDKNITPVWDDVSGQWYAEWVDPSSDDRYKIWIEDASSLQARAELVRKYHLAGLAAWRRGLEEPSLWPGLVEVVRHP